MRRAAFCGMCTWVALLGWVFETSGQDSILPAGDAAAAIVSGHFPDRVHEFVWRNWNAVEPGKLAKILGASVQDVTAVAESMGLPRTPVVPPEMKQRGYITLIRRNWHLLALRAIAGAGLEMTPDRLAFTLREDDFLWVKLGRLKPKCEPLRYQAPNDAARRRAAEIRRVVEQDFGAEIRRPAEQRFEFVRQLSSPMASPPRRIRRPARLTRCGWSIPTWRCTAIPWSNPALNPYPDGFLQRLSAVGVNGVWLHAVLRELAPGGATFPEFGAGHERRLANLRALVERAKKYGIRVYLYMNEPRAMPNAFFKNRPEIAGVRDVRDAKGEYTALCTSHPAVRKWMADALAFIFREVPDLGGIYSITASENLTSCASLGGWKSCERCKSRTDTEIIAEVVATLEEGVHRGNPKANVVVSDWGWKGHGDAVDIVARLPKSVWLMSVSEWALPIVRGGIESKVGEYAISAVGPGPRAPRHWAAARQIGVKTAAEIQFNNTCELASLPLSSGDGPGGRARPQPGPGKAQRHDDWLDHGRTSFAQLRTGSAIEPYARRQRRPGAGRPGARAIRAGRRHACPQGVDAHEQRLS